MSDLKPPCARCGESAFPVELIAPTVPLCQDCVQWVGQGTISSVTAEYLQWASVPDVGNLPPVYGTCYQRRVKQVRAERRFRPTPAKHGFSSLNQLSERFARSSRGKT